MGVSARHEYKVEVLSDTGRWLTACGTHIYKEWRTAADKYTELAISRPNDKFRIVWRCVSEWKECYT